MTIDLGNNRQLVVSPGSGKIRLSIWAYGGNLGVELNPQQAEEAGLILFQLGRKGRR